MSLVNWREPDNKPKAEIRRDELQLRASIAQLLLVARLRARNRRDLAVDSLENAARVIFVTCKNWFSPEQAVDAVDSLTDHQDFGDQPVRATAERHAPDEYKTYAHYHEETNAYRHH
jgi:hypothetical protein